MKTIGLTRGMSATIDSRDFSRVSKHAWRAERRRKKWYARSTIGGKNVYLHRFIMRAPAGIQVNHWDNDGLHNRRSNLILCSNAENNRAKRNRPLRYFSRFRGVSFYRRDGCWRGHITVSGKQIHLGYFTTEKAAANAYNISAFKHFGRFAIFNPVTP